MLTHNPAFVQNQSKIRLLASSLKSSLELVKTSACIDKLLLTGVEGMALRTNFNSDFAALGGLGFSNFAACASDNANFVVRMDSVFHLHVPLFKNLMFFDIGESPLGRQTAVLYHKIKKIARLHFTTLAR